MSVTNSAELPISKELLDILRCPLAVQEKTKYGDDPGRLELVHGSWLVSADSGLKYPIRDGIPVMLIDEGMKWKDTAVADLPVPPPSAQQAAPAASTSSAPAPQKKKRSWLKLGVLAVVGILVVRFIKKNL